MRMPNYRKSNGNPCFEQYELAGVAAAWQSPGKGKRARQATNLAPAAWLSGWEPGVGIRPATPATDGGDMSRQDELIRVRFHLCGDGTLRCRTCRFRVRGPNHAQGSHHRKAQAKLRTTLAGTIGV